MVLARFLDRVGGVLAAALALTALVVFLSGMAIRALAPSFSGGWAEESTIYLIVWASLLAAADAVAKNEHVRMNVMARMLPPRGRLALGILGGLASFVYCAALGWFGWLTVDFAARIGERGPSAMRFPMAGYYASLPCAMALCVIRIFLQMLAAREESDLLDANAEKAVE